MLVLLLVRPSAFPFSAREASKKYRELLDISPNTWPAAVIPNPWHKRAGQFITSIFVIFSITTKTFSGKWPAKQGSVRPDIAEGLAFLWYLNVSRVNIRAFFSFLKVPLATCR